MENEKEEKKKKRKRKREKERHVKYYVAITHTYVSLEPRKPMT